MNKFGEDRERRAGLRSSPDGATAPRAYARSQANGVSARRLREMINLAPAVREMINFARRDRRGCRKSLRSLPPLMRRHAGLPLPRPQPREWAQKERPPALSCGRPWSRVLPDETR